MSAQVPVEDLKATIAAREEHIRESWVRAMEMRIVREEMAKCHASEGVNHYANCKELAQKYTEMLKTNKVTGWRHIDT
ncbi:hypothetical protein BOTBODRAFT_54362 [Botryobasidium botryosum FD-172 SS1]|uniref:NADH-ubiquinone oxidoreductase 12 kDa subunit n=1 Tax=Botryobasidium botryosum (strain FD-172 SS1) TaxID=930990 RepID=A0A067MMF2_BOTB1|nr:hypothetical protein BOTBODRAFT_54362 [Botryobasidium botryosum FD-172 SS1]